jgi:autotransporter-associated beta strand protein
MGLAKYRAVAALSLTLAVVSWASLAAARVDVALTHTVVARADREEPCRWTGLGPDNRWSTAANWTHCGGAAPHNGGAIEFPRDATRPANQNDIDGLSLAAVQITGPGARHTRYDIAGLPFTFTDTLRIADADDASGAGPIVRTPIALIGRPTVSVESKSLSLTGPLTGTGALIKTGAGTLTLTGDSTYTGGTQVAGGRLIVEGHLNRASPMVIDHGRIGGTGTVGRLSCGTGVIAIGGGSGRVAGTLHADGLVLAGTLLIGLHGPEAGTTYDQLDLTDDATLLVGAELHVDVSAGAAKGTPYTIVHVADGHTLTGTFENLQEGKSVLLGTQHFHITYHGGHGHDVVLTALDDSTPPDRDSPASARD